jgi:hypothetical protein
MEKLWPPSILIDHDFRSSSIVEKCFHFTLLRRLCIVIIITQQRPKYQRGLSHCMTTRKMGNRAAFVVFSLLYIKVRPNGQVTHFFHFSNNWPETCQNLSLTWTLKINVLMENVSNGVFKRVKTNKRFDWSVWGIFQQLLCFGQIFASETSFCIHFVKFVKEGLLTKMTFKLCVNNYSVVV